MSRIVPLHQRPLTRCDCGLTTGSDDGVCEGCDLDLPSPGKDFELLYDPEKRAKFGWHQNVPVLYPKGEVSSGA